MSPDSAEPQVEHLSVLNEFPGDLRARIAAAIRDVAQSKSLGPGERILAEGDSRSQEGYVLLQGALTVSNDGGFAKTVTPPSLMGEMKQFGIAGSARRMATVRAATPAVVLAFAWPALYESLARHLQPDEVERFHGSLRREAWDRFLEMDDPV